jgi:hypothetical protein
LCDAGWVARNYTVHKKFIPLTSSALYPYIANSYMQSMFEFKQSWGGVSNPNDNGLSDIDSAPNNIYTSQFSKDSLVHLKGLIVALQQPNLDSAKSSAYENELKTKLTLYRLSVAKEKPFLYYFMAPLRLTRAFIYGNETTELLKRGTVNPNIGPAVVLFNKLLYLFIVIFGFMGGILLAIKGFKGNHLYWLISLIPIYILVIHPIILRYATNRFLMPAFPFLIACTAYILCIIHSKLFRKAQ